MYSRNSLSGFTLVELVVSVAIGTLITMAVSTSIHGALQTSEISREKNVLIREARFAMERMAQAIGKSEQLILPSNDRPTSSYIENIREQTIPASPPPAGSSNATAVLAIALAEDVDLNGDSIPDADNDGDGRINEDFPADITNDSEPGIQLIDDDGDGQIDEGFFADADDDEYLSFSNEDPINGIDDDGDGSVDEDPSADMNKDGSPGISGVDDDGDGTVDEGDRDDDDEDGSIDEDWLDAVVFHLQGDTLIERTPAPWDTTGDGNVTGRDYVESVIAEGVTLFRVERVPLNGKRTELIDLTLQLSSDNGTSIVLNTRRRLGGRL